MMIGWHMRIHESFRVGISDECTAIINIAFSQQTKIRANGRSPEFAQSPLLIFY